jgi:adenine-specific DNA-methyltransferase
MASKPAIRAPARSEVIDPRNPFERWAESRASLIAAADALAASHPTADREGIARYLCAELVHALWDERTHRDRHWLAAWKERIPAPFRLKQIAERVAQSLRDLSVIEASYLVSSLYTALLPPEIRAERGAFYTPPVLAERLLDLVAAEGVDWLTVTALDPACGGGAFLTPLANRILNDHRVQCLPPGERMRHLEERLAGIEIDAFAAWMSRTFLQLLAYPLIKSSGRDLQIPIHRGDALRSAPGETRRFDLILGNPPYGRVSLDAGQREVFKRSLFGHANLYGLFLDAALRWRSPTGLVAFVTPTSMLGGQYFSRLRDLLLEEAPPLVVDVVEARTGVFESVLQETCLAVFGPNPGKTAVVHLLDVSDRTVKATRAGAFSLQRSAGCPWFLPRSPTQARLAERAETLPTRLRDLGYKASTGPLVWNRHKDQLRGELERRAYPLIWAEAIKKNQFSFAYRSRAHAPFFALKDAQEHLLCGGPCVLVQRTTAKEQDRRLVACAVPPAFFLKWGKLVIENHVNVLHAQGSDPVDPLALAAVLNTGTVDQVFRCLSGTVAVSASELHAIPLPPRETFDEIAALLRGRGSPEAEVEAIVARAYGIEIA